MNRHLKHSRLGASLMATVMMSGLMIEAAGATEVGAPREPVWYIAKEKSLVGNDVVEEGGKVKYAGLPSENLEPTCDEGRRRAAEYKESNAARVKTLISNHSGESAVGDPTAFMKAFTEELARERAEHASQMAALVEQNQQSALLLAEAAKNMALLAAAITAPAAVAETGETATAPAAVANSDAAAGDTKETGTDSTAPAKRTRGA
jgi:hypothetical protein